MSCPQKSHRSCSSSTGEKMPTSPSESRFELAQRELVQAAQNKLFTTQVDQPAFLIPSSPHDQKVFGLLAKAWILWAAGSDPLPTIDKIGKPHEAGKALHLMALDHWKRAIQALARSSIQFPINQDALSSNQEAFLCFQRALLLSSSYQLPSTNSIHWSFVASFPTLAISYLPHTLSSPPKSVSPSMRGH